MSSLVLNHKRSAYMLTHEICRVLGLPPPPPKTTVDEIDWELCGDIEMWAHKIREEREAAEHQDVSLKRKRLPTPDSEVEDSDEDDDGDDIVVARPTRKKPKATITSSSLTRAADIQEPPVLDMSPLASFASMSIDTLEDFPAGGARPSHRERRDQERQNFTIWDDGIVEGSAFDNYGVPMTSWTPVQPDDEKENQPPEFDMAADSEFASEYDEYYYAVEDVHQQESRAVLGEIQVENQI